jgi:3alpha(or 20beta)-hydroxysteroid dehydrogenase
MAGKTVVITGGASGIGLATAERLAAANAHVVLADRDDASAAAERLGGRCIHTDVSDERSVRDMMASAGPIHGLVQAAGVMSEALLTDLDARELERLMRVNAYGVFHGLKYTPTHMVAGGAVVNVSSVAATVGMAGYAAYSASKAAVLALTRAAALEFGSSRIRVNAICPSSVDTPMLQAQSNCDVEITLTRAASPLGALGTPGHVAALVHFLLADDCPDVSGQALNVDGGMTAGYTTDLINQLISTAEIARSS